MINTTTKLYQMIKGMSNKKLLETWNETETHNMTNELATVREYIMDEVKTRNSVLFNEWIDECDITLQELFIKYKMI